ncbi:ATP-binding cassette domain-containing protein [Gammaproteobacteria bacterium]|nr:ATP-binding cassette domain-containing protein [Gammaproteobacteria bacterium]
MIEVSNLAKRYGNFSAVSGISFSVKPGDILGFLGPNGAGKSTTMKMITGFLAPSEGGVRIYGNDIQNNTIEAQRLIGYLPEGAPAYDEMSVETFLRFVCEARGLSGDSQIKALSRVIDMMSLAPVLKQRIQTISKGFKRRVGLAQAILHDPKVLILDEPTDGLDPNQKHEVRKMIRNLSKDKIVVVSTHILEEVSAVCNRAIILNEGKIVADSTPSLLLEKSKYHRAVSIQADPLKIKELAENLGKQPFVSDLEQGGKDLTLFPLDGDQDLLMKVTEACKQNNWEVASIRSEEGRLDEVFRVLTEV